MIHAVTKRRKQEPPGGKEPAAAWPSRPAQARGRPALRSALGLALLLGIPLVGQAPAAQFPSTSKAGQQFPPADAPLDQGSNRHDQKRIQMLNAQRQKDIVSDTQKLLQLAKELNNEVTAADSEHWNDDQMHKVAEIGKLARSVKDKMSYSAFGYPSLNTPLTMPPGVE